MSQSLFEKSQASLSEAQSLEELLKGIETLGAKVAFSSSFGLEDQVLTDAIYRSNANFRIFTLDTGRMFQETYDVLHDTNEKYKKHIEVFFPNQKDVQDLLANKGPNSFYQSVENRKECCFIRKVEPLNRALEGVDIWITGIRREQASTRTELQLVEYDSGRSLVKVNPLLNWSEKELWDRVKENSIPYNALHDKGYPSIGCAPCTRAIEEGEDLRAGRWWWENPESKECGLHIVDGKVVRVKKEEKHAPLHS